MERILPQIEPFQLVQTEIDTKDNQPVESVMSLGNGYMGARGNYEEVYSGKTLKGTYVGGVWIPDKTRVGWWKNGYPRYYGKVINAPDFLSFDLSIDGQQVDLAKAKVDTFQRVVDMETGVMQRVMRLRTPKGVIEVASTRFFSAARREIACMTYAVTSLNFSGNISIATGIDANVKNTDANYGEQFWLVNKTQAGECSYLESKTIPNNFDTPQFTVGFAARVTQEGQMRETLTREERCVRGCYESTLTPGQTVALTKIVSVVTSRDKEETQLQESAFALVDRAQEAGLEILRKEHEETWRARWRQCDVIIEGDAAAQQGIRFNLFQLYSTYDGRDERLNVGPKGFTGEKYGGAAYYDTEGYCFPMYLATAGPKVARSLLLFRYNTLEKAKENAAKIGMGGALYPMVTFNGEECHNEWEITFEELHRNAAVAYAIYCYTAYTGDTSYVRDYGVHVLVEIARFWVSRCTYHKERDQYMLLGVTGPNEYENNINNDFLTNFMAKWCITYALECAEAFGYALDEAEAETMRSVAEKMYVHRDETTKLFLQQDGFLDKDIYPVDQIPPEDLPLCKHWSWDRILRSCFIKQADVILAMYYFPHAFTREEKQVNFRFYEPITVHESSLSPSMYSTVASACGFGEDAYRLFQRATRLDLDNFNADTEDGLHITSMAGAWIAMTHGFAGMNYQKECLSFAPCCPACWKRVMFRMLYRDRLLEVEFSAAAFTCRVLEGAPLEILVSGTVCKVESSCTVPLG